MVALAEPNVNKNTNNTHVSVPHKSLFMFRGKRSYAKFSLTCRVCLYPCAVTWCQYSSTSVAPAPQPSAAKAFLRSSPRVTCQFYFIFTFPHAKTPSKNILQKGAGAPKLPLDMRRSGVVAGRSRTVMTQASWAKSATWSLRRMRWCVGCPLVALRVLATTRTTRRSFLISDLLGWS